MRWSRLALVFALPISACQPGTTRPDAIPVAIAGAHEWRRIAAAEDAGRIEGIPSAWARGLQDARADGFARRIASEGDLLDPEAALPRPAPTPGAYRCRLLRLGGHARGEAAFSAFRPFYCFVGIGDHDDRLSITKSEGSARPAGYLWEDGGKRRMIFLGALAPGAGPAPAYGDDRARDLAGIVERIGPFRWRLVIPRPASGAALEIFEMEPAEVQSEG
ncbi:MAG TPA: DUF4893 domain-containing protein [Allosphingosinicella sp.]